MIRNIIGDYHKLPTKWGVLFIDCYQGEDAWFFDGVIKELQKFKVEAVINCSVSIQIDYQDRSVYNTLQQYLWDSPSMRDNFVNDPQLNQEVLYNLIKCAGSQKTNQLLHDKIFNNKTVHLSSINAFTQHCQHVYPDVKDWIIVGMAWGICVHTGPLGIDKLVSVPDMKFHFFPEWSILNGKQESVTEQEIIDDWYVWSPVPKIPGCYRLICAAQDHDKPEHWKLKQ
jgi:hypothetical protein|tara:strand:- start:51 stop:731 length:681 start_codon:yes stop_codon:yes gene_type:complete